MSKKIAVIVGSLRKGSYSRQIAKNMLGLFPKGYEAEIVEIGQLPFFNQDWEADLETPKEVAEFRKQIGGFDAVLFVIPEYNRSISGVLKNALDVASRPYGQSKWNGKPAAIVSQSTGVISGFGANHHLRQILTFLNMPTLQQPEAYLAKSPDLLDDKGKLAEGTLKFLQTVVDAFVELIKRY